MENHHGSVDVGVPAEAGFVVQASTRHGAVENDFSLLKQGSDDSPELNGTVGKGGPLVRIDTTDGDVTVRKSSVASLPATAPVAQKVSVVPVAPKAPAAPKIRKGKTALAPLAPLAPLVPLVPPAPLAAPAR